MKFLVSLLGLGTTFGGVFIGSIQQNVFRPGKPYIDELFHEIEKDIRDFSEENPITEEDAKTIKNPITKKDVDEIKKAGTSSTDVTLKRKKRNIDTSEIKNPNYTLEAWVYIWVQLVSNYIDKLWKNKPEQERVHPITFTLQEINKALEDSEQTFLKEKQEFEKVLLENLKEIFEKIYKKMREFALLTNFPKGYSTGSVDYPYEHHIKKILEE